MAGHVGFPPPAWPCPARLHLQDRWFGRGSAADIQTPAGLESAGAIPPQALAPLTNIQFQLLFPVRDEHRQHRPPALRAGRASGGRHGPFLRRPPNHIDLLVPDDPAELTEIQRFATAPEAAPGNPSIVLAGSQPPAATGAVHPHPAAGRRQEISPAGHHFPERQTVALRGRAIISIIGHSP